ncbi:hypothetical protein B1207_08470 [Legionella quinlivanii]|uniref:ABC transporter ATP-binding protein n=1 Tax=Legionella quinlivanii TaxID=45073 RepID=A0A364LIB8_9GAMM|nr:ATP-binding cassette domain-containing protein [Legionella quinlivanii]RAP36178.1 hypothetical protein B1207_08470 [Legionella quinlivanii]
MSLFKFYQSLFRYQKKQPLLFSLLFISVILSVVFQCIQPVIVEWLINDVLKTNNISLLALTMFLLLANYILFIFAFLMRTKILSTMGAKIISHLRYKMFVILQNLNLNSYYKKQSSPLISYFSEHLALIESTTLFSTWSILSDVLLCFIAGALLFYFDWIIALIILPSLVIILALPRFFFRKTAQAISDKQKMDAQILDNIQENIRMQDVIRLELLKEFKKNRFKSFLTQSTEANYRYNINLGLSSASLLIGINFSMLLIYILGGVLVFFHLLSMGSFIAFILLFRNFLSAVNSISNTLPVIMRCASSLKIIEDLLEMENTPGKEVFLPRLEKGIYIKDVTFSYDDRTVLKQISFKIAAGQFLGIVGLSGSGKSTLLKLILKEITPASGTIFFDSTDYRDFTQETLLAQTSVVLQEPKLFEGSILENIRMGRLDASENEIIEAAKQAGIHNEIMQLPDTYDTLIGPKNSDLSGGQKQRICIARALVANPAILCLDEASSALDPFSSSLIDETIDKLTGLHTIISITHRLSSVVNADLILVMKEGEIVESGNHSTLVNQNGFYNQLWNKQKGFTLMPEQGFVRVNPAWLEHIPLFADFDKELMVDIANNMTTERFDRHEIVFKQGEQGDKFYIIAIGMVDVFSIEDGEEIIIASLSDGDFFGEVALLYNCERNATVKTSSTCLFLSLSSDGFYKIIEHLPKEKKDYLLEKAYARLSGEQKLKNIHARFTV